MKLSKYEISMLNELLDKYIKNLGYSLKYTSDMQVFQDLCSKYNFANRLKEKLMEENNEQ